MKILLIGNHTCGNRGDGAILRGIHDSLLEIDKTFEIVSMSRYPISSSYLLGREITVDPLYQFHKIKRRSLIKKIKKVLINRFVLKIMMSYIKNKGILKIFPMPSYILKFIKIIDDFDVIVQVGGSFFVDLYGANQFEHALCALFAKKPIFFIGHSVGPFKNKDFSEVADFVFSRIDMLILREEVSLSYMRESSISESKVIQGVDTAWLVNPNNYVENSYVIRHWQQVIKQRPTVAVTLRNLSPFDKRLGVTQDQYEFAFAHLINHVINLGYQVIAFSTCTGIESYDKDDRMVALSLKKYIENNDYYNVVMDELNDTEMGVLLKECILTLGTRLHSAIISMNFGTPALAFNYEHKSLGIMRQLDLSDYGVDIQKLINNELNSEVELMLENIESIKMKVAKAVGNEKEKGVTILRKIFAKEKYL